MALIIKSAVFWLEESLREWFCHEEGPGEVVVVAWRPEESLSLFPLSISGSSALRCVSYSAESVAMPPY